MAYPLSASVTANAGYDHERKLFRIMSNNHSLFLGFLYPNYQAQIVESYIRERKSYSLTAPDVKRKFYFVYSTFLLIDLTLKIPTLIGITASGVGFPLTPTATLIVGG